MIPIQKFCYKIGSYWKQILFFLLLTVILVFPACAPAGGEDLPPESEAGVLTYAALDPLDGTQRRRILTFNSRHEDAQIEVLDYSDEGGIDRLMTELSLGKVPDIMELHRLGSGEDLTACHFIGDRKAIEGEYWMPYRQLARKGYLEDLWPYIENDPRLGREGVVEAPLKAAEVDGGLYMLFRNVYINTLVGRESVVGKRDGWTLEELMDAFAAMPDGSTILRYNATRREMYSSLFCTTLDRYIDWETGECSFDNDEFRSMLEFLATFPAEFKTSLTENELKEELFWRRVEGEQMLEAVIIYWLKNIPRRNTAFGGKPVAYVGYPTTDGSSGSFFHINGTVLAMASTCRNKEAAWAFMSYLTQPGYSVTDMATLHWGIEIMIPINRKSYENGNAADLSWPKELISPTGTFPGGPEFQTDPPTEEDLQLFERLVNNTKQIYWPDDALSETVWEAIGPYFAGDKTLDETIQLVQNRVKLYVNENR